MVLIVAAHGLEGEAEGSGFVSGVEIYGLRLYITGGRWWGTKGFCAGKCRHKRSTEVGQDHGPRSDE